MDIKFSKGSNEAPQQELSGEKKNQSALLVLLLLLVGGFLYTYFFTDLIKQPEASKIAEVPKPAVVKMPLPSRDAATVMDAKTNSPADATSPNTQTPKQIQNPPVASVAASSAGKTPLAAVKPKEEPKKPEQSKPLEKNTQPAPVSKPDVKVTATGKKPVTTDRNNETAKSVSGKKIAVKVEKHHKATPAKTSAATEKAGDGWSILVGHYVLEEALSADMGRVRKAGLAPVVKAGVRKKTSMNRLMLAEFATRDEAQTAIAKLKRYTSDAFIIYQGGKQVVYAGSYLLDSRAASEKERLTATGFPVTLKRTEIAIPTQSLSIGPFSDKKNADAAVGKLKVVGINATIVRQ